MNLNFGTQEKFSYFGIFPASANFLRFASGLHSQPDHDQNRSFSAN